MTKIADFKEKEHLNQYLMIKSCTKGLTQKGAPYLNMVLQDSSGTIDGKLWDCKPEDEKLAIAGEVALLDFEVLEYNHSLQLRINRIEKLANKDEISLDDYIQSSYMDEKTRIDNINNLIQSIKNDNLKKLVSGVLEKVGQDFYTYPAASKIHHSYLGGLAEHTIGMASLAEDIVKRYPLLNRDLLISGIIVHDMGKTCELGGLISAEYTNEGRLVGHISICHGWIVEVAEKLGLSSCEETMLLRHLVLSHHGKLEFGSPVMPEIPEAEVLSMIDNLDARMNTLKSAFETTKKGQWTSKLFSMENRQFYHHGLDEEE